MEIIYAALSIVAYFLVFRRNRKFDFLSVGFLSQQLYFSPVLFQAMGYCSYLGCLDPSVSLVGFWLVTLFIGFSIFNVRTNKALLVLKPEIDNVMALYVAFSLAIFGFIWLVYSSSGGIFYLPKREMMQYLSYNFIIWSFASSFGLLMAVKERNRLFVVVFSLSLAVTVYIGFRSVAAIALISVFLMISIERGLSLSRLSKVNIFLIIFAGLFFFIYKGFYSLIKQGYYEVLLKRIFSFEYYISIFESSEPVMTASILSNVIEYDLYIGSQDYFRLLSVFTFNLSELFGDDNFNSVIQPLFYSEFSGGVGSNVWAYMYSTSSALGLAIFCFLYVASLWALSRVAIRCISSSFLSVFVVYFSVYWSFYIHRNDLVYQLTLQKRVLLVAVIIYCISFFACKVLRSTRKC